MTKIKIDVHRALKEALFAIVNNTSHRDDVSYGGVKVQTPDGTKVAWLRLTFEPEEKK